MSNTPNNTYKKNVLIATYNKSNIEKISKAFSYNEYNIYGTSNTTKQLNSLGINCIDISTITGHSDLLGGKVKTLNEKIFCGLLASQEEREFNNVYFDVVICNLYPFHEDNCQKNIDIGGHAIIRACIKNQIPIICNVNDYDHFIELLNNNSLTFESTKLSAIKYIIWYDSMVYNWRSDQMIDILDLNKSMDLSYGENHHQSAQVYIKGNNESLISDNNLSYNNVLDMCSGIKIVAQNQGKYTAVVIKHNNPCGAAVGDNQCDVLRKAINSDKLSAFGGILVMNFQFTKDMVEDASLFLQVLVCNGFDSEETKILVDKKIKIVIDDINKFAKYINKFSHHTFEFLPNHFIRHEINNHHIQIECIGEHKPTDSQMHDAVFAFHICKYVKSNAIVIVKNGQTLGIGAGQTSRILSASIAKDKKIKITNANAVAASDAFFPFNDGLEILLSANVDCIVTPMGSKNDANTIKFCNDNNICLLKTNIRVFNH